MISALRVAILSGALACAAASASAAPLTESELIGAWRLVRTQIEIPDGRTFPVPNYGSDPNGYLIYDRSHLMCVFLAVGTLREPPPPQYRELMPPIPASYCARWHITDSGDEIVHEVLVGNDPSLLRAPLRRKAQRRGQMLELRRNPTPAGLRDYVLVFEKVSATTGPARVQ